MLTTHSMKRNPPIQAILPALTVFHYEGCNEYMEDFSVLARIDTPRLWPTKIQLLRS
jgi:hypothetical protein